MYYFWNEVWLFFSGFFYFFFCYHTRWFVIFNILKSLIVNQFTLEDKMENFIQKFEDPGDIFQKFKKKKKQFLFRRSNKFFIKKVLNIKKILCKKNFGMLWINIEKNQFLQTGKLQGSEDFFIFKLEFLNYLNYPGLLGPNTRSLCG